MDSRSKDRGNDIMKARLQPSGYTDEYLDEEKGAAP